MTLGIRCEPRLLRAVVRPLPMATVLAALVLAVVGCRRGDADSGNRKPDAGSVGGDSGPPSADGGSGLATGSTGTRQRDPCACENPKKSELSKPGFFPTTHLPLHCLCGSVANHETCPPKLDDAFVKRLCREEGFIVVKAEGCGRIDIGQIGRFAGSSFTFDANTKKLIGVYSYTDTLDSDCKENTRVYGRSLFPPEARVADDDDKCEAIKRCVVCGPPTGNPRCTGI